jgi:hypothetical protein
MIDGLGLIWGICTVQYIIEAKSIRYWPSTRESIHVVGSSIPGRKERNRKESRKENRKKKRILTRNKSKK